MVGHYHHLSTAMLVGQTFHSHPYILTWQKYLLHLLIDTGMDGG